MLVIKQDGETGEFLGIFERGDYSEVELVEGEQFVVEEVPVEDDDDEAEVEETLEDTAEDTAVESRLPDPDNGFETLNQVPELLPESELVTHDADPYGDFPDEDEAEAEVEAQPALEHPQAVEVEPEPEVVEPETPRSIDELDPADPRYAQKLRKLRRGF